MRGMYERLRRLPAARSVLGCGHVGPCILDACSLLGNRTDLRRVRYSGSGGVEPPALALMASAVFQAPGRHAQPVGSLINRHQWRMNSFVGHDSDGCWTTSLAVISLIHASPTAPHYGELLVGSSTRETRGKLAVAVEIRSD